MSKKKVITLLLTLAMILVRVNNFWIGRCNFNRFYEKTVSKARFKGEIISSQICGNNSIIDIVNNPVHFRRIQSL